jgi:Tfp pilus assembly protein PilF
MCTERTGEQSMTRNCKKLWAMLGLTMTAVAAATLSGCGPRVITIDPGNTSAQIARAAELADDAQRAERQDNKDRAIRLYQEAIAAYNDFHPAWNNMGVLLMEKGIYAQAAEAFKRAGELAPLDPRPMTNLGLIYLRRGYDKQAAEYFTQALSRDDGYLPALREAVRLDVQTDRITDVSSARVDKALLLETDQRWMDQLRRYKIQIEQRLVAADPYAP